MATRFSKVKNRTTGALAVYLVSVFTTGIEDAAAAIIEVKGKGDLKFGDVIGDPDVGGTVVISPAGAKTLTGGVVDFNGHDPGKFRIKTDTAGEAYSCFLPSSIQITEGANNITVDTFTTSPPLSGSFPPGEIEINMTIGGTAHLAAGQPAGKYAASYTLTCGAKAGSKNIKLTVITPISISSSANMDFGTVVPTGTAGTVIVTPAGARSSTDVILFGGTPAAASFDVTAQKKTNYFITLPSSTTLSSGANTMTVDTFNHDAGASPKTNGGGDTFNVGATLNVGATQAAGAYSGTFTVTVHYN